MQLCLVVLAQLCLVARLRLCGTVVIKDCCASAAGASRTRRLRLVLQLLSLYRYILPCHPCPSAPLPACSRRLPLQPREMGIGLAVYCCMPTSLSTNIALTQVGARWARWP